MAQDLPVYPDSGLRSGRQFADLARFAGRDISPARDRVVPIIAAMESSGDVVAAQAAFKELSIESFLRAHRILFAGRAGAGEFRTESMQPIYRGQDCAPPEFIARSLENLLSWVSAESFSQIHPIERAALCMARVLDVWPFAFGNLTLSIVFANAGLDAAGLAPFSVRPEHRQEFESIVTQALGIETQPLVNAIYATVRREMESLAPPTV